MFFQTQGERCDKLAQYLIEHQATVRRVAIVFSISKSTVHKDIAIRLKRINPGLYKEAQKVLEQNKQERHLRGGEATKQKYLQKKLVQ